MKLLKYLLIFIFGLACLFAIETCYHDYIYSNSRIEQKVLDDFSNHAGEYIQLLNFAAKLSDSIQWDSISKHLKHAKYSIDDVLKVGINIGMNSENFSLGYDGIQGCNLFLPNILNDSIDDGFIRNTIKSEIGISKWQLDSFINYSSFNDGGEFSIYPDGSVVINKNFGPDIFDVIEYEIIYKGPHMFLHGNYRNMLVGNIFIGKQN